jgi:hypothetical membrane protein
VSGNRLRWGALGWVLTLQFFVVEAVVALQWRSYSYAGDVISDLGSSHSPAPRLMNASFVVQAALILLGVGLVLPALRGAAVRVAQVFLTVAAIGVALVAVFPEDGNGTLHDIGAIGYLGGGAIGLIALAYAVRPRSEPVATVLAVLGLAGAATTVFFLTDITQYLGRGGTERIAAYVLPVGLTVAAVTLWRMTRGGVELAATVVRPSRRELRAQARQEQAERERERDAALEAAAGRRAGTATGALPSERSAAGDPDPDDLDPDDLDPDDLDPDDLDPDDPWAAPGRRREN